jgi:hypothetical protein
LFERGSKMADLVLDWGALGPYGTNLTDGDGAVSATVDTGGVAVDISFDALSAGATAFTFDAPGYVAPGETFSASSYLKLFGEGIGGPGDTSTAVLDFRATDTALYTDSVQNVSFRLNDIDMGTDGDLFEPGLGFEDIVSVTAFDAAGNPVPVTLSLGSAVTNTGGDLTGSAETGFEDASSSVLVEITGPVSSILVSYANGDDSQQGVTISDIEFSTVDVSDDNDPPDAVDDGYGTAPGTPITVDPITNDSDPDGDPITVTGITPATNGTAVLNGDGTVTYTPDAGFIGTETISYTLSDGSLTDTATITFTVSDEGGNLAPDAVDDMAATTIGTAVTVTPITNDSDPDGDPITVTGITPATNGTAVLNGDGTVTYTPDAGFTGIETISYTLSDGSLTDTATISITVSDGGGGGNLPPDAVDDAATTVTGTPITVIPAANDSDPDGDSITVTGITPAANGTAVLNGDGTVTYTPDAGFIGTDTITYTLSDGTATDTATITVTVTDDDNIPPTAFDDSGTTEVGTPVIVTPLSNDVDPDGDDALLTISSITQPLNGAAVLNADGTVTYTPDAGYTGTDVFTYEVVDPAGGGDTGVISIAVSDPNAPPVAVDDTVDTDEGTPVTLDPAANDTDPDGDTLTVTDIGTPTNGTAVLNGDGTVTYTPDAGFTGEDTISYVVSDGSATDTGEIVVTVDDGTPRIDADVFPVDPADQPLDPLNDLDEDPDPLDNVNAVTGDGTGELISTGDDNDTISAGGGDDTVNPGIDDDLVNLGAGDDSLFDVQGADTISGGTGDDTIIAGTNTFSDYEGDDPAFAPGTLLNDLGFTADPNQEDGRDSVQGNRGNDSISTGDDADTIDGGGENDTLDGGIDDDLIMGGQGDDYLIGSHGSDSLDGGQGNDTLDGSNLAVLELIDAVDVNTENDRDLLQGFLGDDSLIGGDDDDTLQGGSGEDTLDGGIDDDLLFGGGDDDTLMGGQGNDTLNGGAGDDSIMGGSDRDVINVDSASDGIGDTVDGGSGGFVDLPNPADAPNQDYDILDLGGVGERNVDWRVVDETADSNGNGLDGTIEFLNGSGAVTGTMDFFEIEEIVCFTPGTLIATPHGERLVEDLSVGDRVITRDNGIQEIRWTGRRDLTGFDLARKPHFKPILIQQGALGNNLPEHDMLVSPNHRVLVANDKTALYFEEREVLVAAKHLTGLDGVDEVEANGVSYIHVMFEQHEVILSNGAWTESFQPGDYSLRGIGNAQRQEILELFPELEHAEGLKAYASARRSLKKHEAALLTE